MTNKIIKVLILIGAAFVIFLLLQFAQFTPFNGNFYWVFLMGGLAGFLLRWALKK